jgi:hypothetical protein
MRYTGLSRGIGTQVHLTLGSHIGSTRWQTSIIEVLTEKAINVITRHRSALVTGFLYTFSYTPFDHYYLSLICMYLDTIMCLNTFILETSNMVRGSSIVCRKHKLMTKLHSVAWLIGPLASFQPEPSLFSSGEKDNYLWL